MFWKPKKTEKKLEKSLEVEEIPKEIIEIMSRVHELSADVKEIKLICDKNGGHIEIILNKIDGMKGGRPPKAAKTPIELPEGVTISKETPDRYILSNGQMVYKS